MILKCPFCKVDVDPGTQTCPSCSKEMVKRCPQCDEEISVLAPMCKYCGEEKPEIVYVEEAAPAAAIAWEEPKRGFFSRWWRNWFDATCHPGEFMQRMPKEGGYAKPIGYVYGMFVQGLLVFVLLASAVGLGAVVAGVPVKQHHTLAALAVILLAIPLGYVAIAAGSFIGAGFWHLMAKLAGGKGTFQGTFRMVAYAQGAQVWGVAGALPQLLFQALLLYHGFRQVHGLSKGRAIGAILMPAIVLCALIGVAVIVAVAVHAGRAV
jgi:hypothetical protein